MTKIFDKKINFVLALAFSLLIANSSWFVIFSSYIVQLGAFAAIGSFLVLMVVGFAMYSFGKGKEIYYASNVGENIKNIRKKMKKLEEKMEEEDDEGKKRHMYEEWKSLKDKVEYLEKVERRY